jgi:hypothetical protein
MRSGKFQNALVGQFDLPKVTERETDWLPPPECSNPALSQDRAGRASIQRPTLSDCGAGEAHLLNGSNEAGATKVALMMISGRAEIRSVALIGSNSRRLN